ncbi:glutathione S-transferase family protein [Pseudomonas sp. HK3]|jgi:glutathione S-transferase
MSKIQVYGWDVSPFTAKVRSYLSYKQLDPDYKVVSAWQLNYKIKKDVGQIIMPVVYDDNTVLQDSSVIIDHYEQKYSSKAVIPDEPLHKICAYILELLGDEWLPLSALHYRWHYPENNPFIYGEFGRSALPKFPTFMQSFVAKKMGAKMAGYLPILGINEAMQQPLETNTHSILNFLNLHLAQHTFIFGTRPSLADFSLYGPIYAHLYRDPFPDKLITSYPHIINWINTLNGPINLHNGEWLETPTLPLSLLPILQIWSQTHVPLIKESIRGFTEWCQYYPDKTRLPRTFGSTTLTIDNIQSKRLNLSYVLWMWQRLQTVYNALKEHEKNNVDALLNQLGVLEMIQTPLVKKIQLKQCRLHLAPC